MSRLEKQMIAAMLVAWVLLLMGLKSVDSSGIKPELTERERVLAEIEYECRDVGYFVVGTSKFTCREVR